jgi:GTP pyrophosphokinase
MQDDPDQTQPPRLGSRFERALVYATRAHDGQLRKGSAVPYLAHLLGVASLALEHGATEEEAIAALLHDAVEDQGGDERLAEIAERFGPTVAAIVEACSDAQEQPKPPWRQRKEAHLARLQGATNSVHLVVACDKLHNIRSILRDYHCLGEALWRRFRGGREGTLWYYRATLELLQRPGRSALTDELRRALEALERLTGDNAGDPLAAGDGWRLRGKGGGSVQRTVRSLLKEKGHEVWSVAPDVSVFDAIKLMTEKKIGAVLVLRG